MPLSRQQEEALVRAASEMPAEQREAFLETMCAGDARLRSRLAELLDNLEKHSTAPDQAQRLPATIKIELPPEDEAIGKNIGPYKLLQKIGEGGCGAVYMADQEQPVHRRVAVKVIKLGMDTKAVIARFEAERQALALMDHPNIAKVLDAGSTESGRPYFVMELVRGIKITEYCDQNKLPTRERIGLFIKICQAIQHAHQKGIIHRDIKPSNILVTLHDGVPIPKVIDFGIAKATTGQRLTDKTLFTAYEQFIGTPAYMSPEQAEMSGLDIDTRSDIYSLGVLLYELLTGRTPFDPDELMKSGLDAMRKTIREREPVRPSTKVATLQGEELTTTAARRAAEVPKLISLLRGDLDWVAMKCLEKDRTRRYETANGLAIDLKRHLDNEPVSARPPSAVYKFQKAIRRNKLAVTAAGVVLATILIGLGLAMAGFYQARLERDRAEAALAEAQQQRTLAENNFREACGAVEDVLRIANQTLVDRPGLQPLCLSLTKAAIDRYEPFLAKPIVDPTPREELARLYAQYGRFELERSEIFDQQVMDAFQKAQHIQEQLLQEHPGDRSIQMDLGWTFILEEWRSHEMPPSPEQSGQQAIAIFRKVIAEDPSDPFARDNLVWALWRTAVFVTNNAEASSMADEAIRIGEQLIKEYPASAEFRRDLANALNVRSFPPTHSSHARDDQADLLFALKGLVLKKAVLADLQANRPEAFRPQRPEDSEANMFRPSVMWGQDDVGFNSASVASRYGRLGDWPHAAEIYNQAVIAFVDLVQNNPSVATFGENLVYAFSNRVNAAENENNRALTMQWSKDAVDFWDRIVELHPEVPVLQKYAGAASEQKAQVAKWLANPATQP